MRSKTKNPPNSLVRVFTDAWTDDWVGVADQLCITLDLPDLTTRSGLKKVHNDLPAIEARLNQTFKYARRCGNTNILGGVLSIYAKMCIVDSILQDKLLGAGLLDKIVALTSLPEARYVALRTLNAITLRSGKRYRTDLVKCTPTLVKLLQQHPDDVTLCSVITAIFSHSVYLFASAKDYFDFSVMTQTILQSLRHPVFSGYMFDHALSFFSKVVTDISSDCRNIPSFTTFLIALLRGLDFRHRVWALDCLLQIHDPPKGKDRKNISSFGLAAALNTRELPKDLEKLLDAFGRENSEMYTTHRSSVNYLALHVQHSFSPDLIKLGHGIGAEVLASRFPVPELLCSCCNHPMRHPDDKNSLLECATALRKQADSNSYDLDLADALEWRHLFVRDSTKASKHAEAALARNPSFGFFHYAVALGMDQQGTLRASKKGLKCAGLPLWLRIEFLRLAVEAALYLGLPEALIKNKDERVAVLLGAYADAKRLVDISPPDSVGRQRDLSMYILLALLVAGPRADLASADIQRALKEITVSEKFMEFLGNPIDNEMHLNITRQAVVDRMSESMEEWGAMLQRCCEERCCEDSRALTLPEPAFYGDAEALSVWLTKFEEELRQGKEDNDSDDDYSFDIFSDERLVLLQCSWCRRSSAVLKKCGRCGKARYCDLECQKLDWKEHKHVCGRSPSKAPTHEHTHTEYHATTD